MPFNNHSNADESQDSSTPIVQVQEPNPLPHNLVPSEVEPSPNIDFDIIPNFLTELEQINPQVQDPMDYTDTGEYASVFY